MNLKPWSSSKPAALLAVLICLSSSAACADVLRAKEDWAVGPIKAKAENGRPFCSLKNSYEGGATLVFARDTSGANSLAIEFPSKTLSAGASYGVLFSLPPLQREASAIAATTKVLIAQFGQDADFYVQLARHKRLGVVTIDREMAFDTRGIAKALDALQECVTAVVKGKKFASVKIPVPKEEDFAEEGAEFDPPISSSKTTYINVTPKEAKEFNPASMARADMLQSEVDNLRAKNRILMLENQKFESELLAAEQETAAGAPPPAAKFSSAQKSIAWPKRQSFSEAVAAYIAIEAATCAGDFAHKLGPLQGSIVGAMQEAEVACMGGEDGDRAAALLFIGRKGKLRLISHRGPAGQMEKALAQRDKAVEAFRKGEG